MTGPSNRLVYSHSGLIPRRLPVLLLWQNNRVLKGALAMHPVRFVALLWACAFFGYFAFVTLREQVPKLWG